MTDFPDDLGCIGEDDESESDKASAQCSDGRDNDGDGKTDYPNDPGCFAKLQDSEEDACPGIDCPQCADGIDNDNNGLTDFPADAAGCEAASDNDEYTKNETACGNTVVIDDLPFTLTKSGTLMAGAPSRLQSPTCGGSGTEHVYELRVLVPKVVVATTNTDMTTADTVLYIRSADCQSNDAELACNDNVATNDKQSTITHSISTPGTYYLVVDSRDAVGGSYEVQVKYFIGEGTTCLAPDECGPGLVCRVPAGGTGKICTKNVCEDGLDDDGDTKIDYPNDPGCDSPTDADESDTCPATNCPECSDLVDNDMDGAIDFGASGDPTCSAASSASEACVSTDGVTTLVAASTMGTTVGAVNDVKVPCATPTATNHTAPEKTYRLDVPALTELQINNVNTSYDAAVALYDSTCAGTPLQCNDEPENLMLTNVAAGTYYYVVDGYSSATGAYTINISGKIQNGASCESALAQSGALQCNLGYACQGNTGTRTCQPAVCSDGMDNDNDNKIDYPFDPGCASPAGTSEANPATPPVCANGMDDDMDGSMDYPADYGCDAASGMSEVFCMAETDPTAQITTMTTTGTMMGKTNTLKNSCSLSTSTAPDVAYALNLPVPVATLTLDTNNSQFDTTLSVRTLDCMTEHACQDQGGSTTNASLVTMTGVAPGGYAVVIDGWSSTSGTSSNAQAYTLNVRGTVAPGTFCDSPLFSGGANAVLVCPSGTSCTGNPRPKCQ